MLIEIIWESAPDLAKLQSIYLILKYKLCKLTFSLSPSHTNTQLWSLNLLHLTSLTLYWLTDLTILWFPFYKYTQAESLLTKIGSYAYIGKTIHAMWLFIIKLTKSRSGKWLINAGHSQVNLNWNICNIYPHKKKESLVKGFLSNDTPCLPTCI